MNPAECEHLRDLGAEIALGIADGEDRAWALDHLAECADCRTRIERLSFLADELLLISPAVEPPSGFEARVAEIGAPRASAPARAGFGRRIALPAAAALAAAACAAGAVWFALSDDRDLADSYRDALAVADGEYFDAAPMELPGGEKVGYLYGYQGRTSWVLVVIYDGVATGEYQLEAVTASGEQLPLRSLAVADGRGSAGGATPVAYDELAEVRLLDDAGHEIAGSELGD